MMPILSSRHVQVHCPIFEHNPVLNLLAGAGLGILRKFDFDIALIDEASQITEPCALIPLVKGTKRAILVGDQ